MRNIVLLLLMVSPAFAQYSQRQATVFASSGKPANQATVSVCAVTDLLCATPSAVTIYSSSAGASKTNPFSTDTVGNYIFYAPGGYYTIKESYQGRSYVYIILLSVSGNMGVGTFTNTQQNNYLTAVVNGLNIGAEYALQQGGNFATEGIVGAVASDLTSTVHQTNGISGYVTNASTTTQAVGVFGNARATAANAAAIGANFVAAGTASVGNAQLASAEFDMNIANTTDTGSGISVVIAGAAQSTNANAINITTSGGKHWTAGLIASPGATTGGNASAAISLQSVATGVNQASQSINFLSNDPTSGTHSATLDETALGAFRLANTSLFTTTAKVNSSAVGSGTSAGLASISAGQASLALKDTTQGVDAKLWDFAVGVTANVLYFRTLNDAENASIEWLKATRTGISSVAVDLTRSASVALPATSIKEYQTPTNCAGVGTAASPSVVSCGTANAGHFSCATNATGATCQVNTSAVTASSEIFVFESDTAATGTALGVTCNTSTTVNPATRLLASYVTSTSFTINLGTVTTNPACFSYFIVN